MAGERFIVMKWTPGAPAASSSAACSVAHATPSCSTASGSASRERSASSSGSGIVAPIFDVKRRDLADVGHGHDPRDDRDGHAGGAGPGHEVEVHAVVEEEVGDQVAGAGVGLALRGTARPRRCSPTPGASPGSTRRRRRSRIAAVINSINSLLCANPPSVGTKRSTPSGGSPRSASTLSMPCVAQPVENRAQLVDGRVDAGQVRHRLDVELVADARHQVDGARAHGAAGAVRHRDERRLELAQVRDRLEELTHAVVGLGREELEREDRLTSGLRGRCQGASRAPCYGHADACGIRVGSRRRRSARQSRPSASCRRPSRGPAGRWSECAPRRSTTTTSGRCAACRPRR